MKLISKVTLLLAGVLTFTFAVNVLVLNTTVMSSFAELERDTAMQNSRRVTQAIERELSFLRGIGRDWASWTDTRDFALGLKPDYAEQNLIAASLTGLKANSLFLVDRDARVVWGLSLDLETEEAIDIAELPTVGTWNGHPLLQAADADESDIFTGLMRTDRGIMAVVSAPILDSDAKGPAAGTLVWGKLLSGPVLELLAQQTGVAFELVGADAEGLPRELGATEDPIVVEASDMVLAGYQILRDTAGKSIGVIRSQTPRDITRNGTHTLMAALGLLVLAGLAVMATVAFGLRMIALKPLSHLTETVAAIARTGDLKSRSGMTRNDEIGALSKHFDEMLDELVKAREAIREQSYYTGILEMSAGLMHNLRNSLNPVTTGIWSALEILRQNRLENFSRAIKELSELEVDGERRSKLFSYVGQMAQQIAEERVLLKENILQLEIETRAIGEILDQQNKLNRPELCIEAVSLRDVIDGAVKLVPLNSGILLDVVCPEDAPPVAGNQILLSQVVGNILVNAVEAIRATGRGEGTIKVLVSCEGGLDVPCARISVEDDGHGIAPDVMPKVFGRGFSTHKQASGGLGLHWCANTTTAMGGRLTLESHGVGKGALARLDLKLAAGQARSQAA